MDPVAIPLLARDGSPQAVAYIDASDAPAIQQYVWRLATRVYKNKRWFYAKRKEHGQHKFMHAELLGTRADHINGDGLDNRRANLRPASQAENMQNKRTYQNNRSGVRGVYWDPVTRRWRAQATLNGAVHRLGRFPSIEEAAQVVSQWRRAHMPFAVESVLLSG